VNGVQPSGRATSAQPASNHAGAIADAAPTVVLAITGAASGVAAATAATPASGATATCGETGSGIPTTPTAQFAARCAARRLQYGLMAAPCGVWIST
jgi:hypothetical protein